MVLNWQSITYTYLILKNFCQIKLFSSLVRKILTFINAKNKKVITPVCDVINWNSISSIIENWQLWGSFLVKVKISLSKQQKLNSLLLGVGNNPKIYKNVKFCTIIVHIDNIYINSEYLDSYSNRKFSDLSFLWKAHQTERQTTLSNI